MTFLAVVIVFSTLILVHEAGHFLMAKKMGVRVEKFAIGFGPKIFSMKRNDTEYLICAIPLGGYVKMAGDEQNQELTGKPWEYFSKSPMKRLAIVASGPLTNYILAFLLFSAMFFIGTPVLKPEIGEVAKDFPAYEAGLNVNDTILKVGSKEIKYWDDLVMAISSMTEKKPVELTVLRDNEHLKVNLIPEVVETKNIFNQKIKIGRIGIKPSGNTIIVKSGIFKSIYLGAEKILVFTGLTYKTFWHMLTGGVSLNSVAGPIGVVDIIGKAANKGLIYLIYIAAQINLAIAIFNLLPFPVLDGGHILFLLIEKVRKKRLDPKVEDVITKIAIFLLISLMVVVSWNDITKFFNK